nr:hypothetical protein [Tanacetum cinerariifolium]
VALDEALVPSTQRLRIGRSNFRLPSDIQSKEPTLQVATAKLHQHSIGFKMDTRKHVLNLEAFREMLHISPRIPGQSFAELPFEEEILEFLRFLEHSTQIKTLTDVNVNKLYQPWRSFAAVINKCLTGKSSGIDKSEGDKTDDDADDQDKAEKVNDDDDDKEETTKIGEQEVTESDEGDDEATKSDRESEDEETKEQE